MKRLILAYILVAAWMPYPIVAQTSNGDNPKSANKDTYKAATSKDTTGIIDYKSFFEYIGREEKKLKTPKITNDTGAVRKVLKEKGIEFSSSTVWASTKDRSKLAYQSPDKNGVAVVDSQKKRIEIYSVNGEMLRAAPFSKYPTGPVAFSETRLFVVKSCLSYDLGFEIYDFSGKLLKSISDSCVRGYVVSENSKYFAITAGSPSAGKYFALYDMEGNELWRQKIEAGGGSQIQFSPDNRFAIVKVPTYWSGGDHKILKERKAYLFDVEKHELLSEENYEK